MNKKTKLNIHTSLFDMGLNLLEEADLTEAVTRYFERKHRGKVRLFYPEAIKNDWRRIDALEFVKV